MQGFAPGIQRNEEGLDLLVEAIAKAGYEGKVKIAMDVAASEFHVASSGNYDLNFKQQPNDGKAVVTPDQLLALYKGFCDK